MWYLITLISVTILAATLACIAHIKLGRKRREQILEQEAARRGKFFFDYNPLEHIN
ncbi:MAG: hypothetical protein QM791_06160 [Ferruginibacter sp.]